MMMMDTTVDAGTNNNSNSAVTTVTTGIAPMDTTPPHETAAATTATRTTTTTIAAAITVVSMESNNNNIEISEYKESLSDLHWLQAEDRIRLGFFLGMLREDGNKHHELPLNIYHKKASKSGRDYSSCLMPTG
uniref:Uncharacterized protein n=1 Tax=Glossina austeni TaxID=7395 RepID=A0A1A9VVT2_GLOAU